MHVSRALNAIKKWGTFKSYAEAHALYIGKRKLAKQPKATLLSLTEPLARARASKKVSQKSQESGSLADAPDPELCALYQNDLDKAKAASETARNKEESTAKVMIQFYANLLSADAKYAWNKIV
jgi:hypothetical protein